MQIHFADVAAVGRAEEGRERARRGGGPGGGEREDGEFVVETGPVERRVALVVRGQPQRHLGGGAERIPGGGQFAPDDEQAAEIEQRIGEQRGAL